MILFLSKYPETKEDFREGFFQRVVHIDSLFEGKKKVYLTTSPYRYFRKTCLEKDGENRVVIRCNLILHLALILSLFKNSKLIYIHSIHNLLYQFLFIKIFQKKYILDLHGLVTEEFLMEGDLKRSIIFNKIEKYIYKNISYVIGVSHQLISYYQKKYPNASPEYIIYPILPNNLQEISKEELDNHSKSEKVNFIYSGNLQAWQNIDLMVDIIKKNDNDPQYFFQILTGQVEEMKQKFIDKNISLTNVDIRGVKSDDLADFYKNAHYGFILRDNISVNNVSCPTKLVEYMNYGIVPVVLSDEIGDFKKMGYENISEECISDNMVPRKSVLNVKIIQGLYSESSESKSLIKNLYKD